MTKENKNLWNTDDITPDFYKEQAMEILTGTTLEGKQLPDYKEREYDTSILFGTLKDYRDILSDSLKDAVITTVYGEVEFNSVTRDEMGKFNLLDEYFTAEPLVKACEHQRVAFTREEILAVSIPWKDGVAYRNTSLMNPEYKEMAAYTRDKTSSRTYRVYEENEKAAYDVTFYMDEYDKANFYLEDTGEMVIAAGEMPLYEEQPFTKELAKDMVSKCGFIFGKDYISYDEHDTDKLKINVNNATRTELPVRLNINISSVQGDSDKTDKKYSMEFFDEQTAQCFGEYVAKDCRNLSEKDGIKRNLTTSIIVKEKESKKENDEIKDSLTEHEADNTYIEKFRARTDELFQKIDDKPASYIEQCVMEHVKTILSDYDENAVVVDAVLVGSRCRGFEQDTSDIDVVVEIHGNDLKEDSLFNLINEESMYLSGIKIDINPIIPEKTGTLEEYLPQVEKYFAEKHREYKPIENENDTGKSLPQLRYNNFKIKKNVGDNRYQLIADVRLPQTGSIKTGQVIGEFKNRETAVDFCERNGLGYEDITNYLMNRIENKQKHIKEKKEAQTQEQQQSQNEEETPHKHESGKGDGRG